MQGKVAGWCGELVIRTLFRGEQEKVKREMCMWCYERRLWEITREEGDDSVSVAVKEQ